MLPMLSKLSLTFYTDSMPEDVGGYAELMFVFIRKKYRDDAGIHRHEYEHVAQFWLAWAWFAVLVWLAVFIGEYPLDYLAIALFGASVHPALYMAVRPYRLHCEAAAYARQWNGSSSDLVVMANRLMSKRYDLGLTFVSAQLEISKHAR
ncbi:MAG: hypothetical protein WAW87_03815 [Candidatus Ferrigenium altingense]